MMEFLECGKSDDILADLVPSTKVLQNFQRSAHHRHRSAEGISYSALVRQDNGDVTIIAGDSKKEIETWITLRLPLDAELMELRDIMFH